MSWLLKSLILSSVLAAAAATGQGRPSSYVDPFIGTAADGSMTPGPSLPFGVIRPGPDMGGNTQNPGWAAQGDINGFSQLHVTGTGGGADYGNILIQPTVGPPRAVAYGSSREDEQSAIGYYRVNLSRYHVLAEITAARRTGLYQFTYPASAEANLLIDAGHILSSGGVWDGVPVGEDQRLLDSVLHIESPTEVTGFATVTGGWNKMPGSYTVYFYLVTDTPAVAYGTWRGNGRTAAMMPGNAEVRGKSYFGAGGWLRFITTQGQQVHAKIGVSFISAVQARDNALREIPGFDFGGTRQAAIEAWDKALSGIEMQGATAEQKTAVYSALYRAQLMPADRSGENPLFASAEPYYDDFYTIWDTFRTSSPLLSLIAPEREAAIVRALVDLYRHEGWLPDGRMKNYNGRMQGGSNADMVIADAYLKKLPGIDWASAYAAMVKDAEISPVDYWKEGRGGLEDWKTLGYLTMENVDLPGSRTVEYAANDYSLSLVARGLGKAADAEKYLARSGNWKNIWDSSFTDGGFTGFIRPRHRDGTWKAGFAAGEGGTFGTDNFYEAGTWTYSFYVPQDMRALVALCGGAARFIERLDAAFPDGSSKRAGGFSVDNEPGFLMPYLYHWAGRPDRTAVRVRQILIDHFHLGRDGIPGNDDSGAMSSLLIFGMIGIFPVAGQDVYLIASPQIPRVRLNIGGGKHLDIIAKDASPAHPYVVAAWLNHRPLHRAWFRHGEIAAGGTLQLKMAAAPGHWGEQVLPPSSSDPLGK